MERTDRIIRCIDTLRCRIEGTHKGSIIIDYANGSLAVKVIELMELPREVDCCQETLDKLG